jgi:hypothetical protein
MAWSAARYFAVFELPENPSRAPLAGGKTSATIATISIWPITPINGSAPGR